MIRLARIRDERMNAQFRGQALRESSFDLLNGQRRILRGEIDKPAFDSKLWKKAKAQLLAESRNKCAYCDTPVTVNSFGDVEHYRPKSVYWWLAYCVENYLASCTVCNQQFKSDRFPIAGSKLSVPRVRATSTDEALKVLAETLVPDPLDPAGVAAFETLHDSEVTLLVNPYIDDPGDYFAWRADVTLREVELVPANDSDLAQVCVEAAKDHYGLDRIELRRLRYYTFEAYLSTKMNLAESGLSAPARKQNQRTLDGMLGDDYPYAGMIRFFESRGSWEDWIAGGYLILPLT